jgi:hypothetical protein
MTTETMTTETMTTETMTTATVTTEDATINISRDSYGEVISVRDLGHARQKRVRRIEDAEIPKIVANARDWAIRTREVQIGVHVAGQVAHAYGYPASTEAVIVVAWPDGRVWLRRRRIDAHKRTRTWHVEMLTGVRGYQDARRRPENQKAAEQAVEDYAAEQMLAAARLAR